MDLRSGNLVGVIIAGNAFATLPGKNGIISYERGRGIEPRSFDVFQAAPDAQPLDDLRMVDNARGPTWSPDGVLVAFTRSVEGISQLFVFNKQTGATTQLTSDSSIKLSPAWSPNGMQLAYIANGAGIPGKFGQAFIADLAVVGNQLAIVGNVRQVTNEAGDGVAKLSWSIQGNLAYTVFPSSNLNNRYIAVISANVNAGVGIKI